MFIIVLLLGANLLGADNISDSSVSIIKNLSESFSKIRSFRAKVEVVIGDKHNKEHNVGILYFKKPNMYKLETYSNSNLQDLIIRNDKTKWHYVKMINTAFKYNISESEESLNSNEYDLNELIFNYMKQKNMNYIGRKLLDNEYYHCFTFELIKDKNKNYVTIYIRDRDGIIKQIEMFEDKSSFFVRQTLYNIETNVKISNLNFIFVPNKNTQVVDANEKLGRYRALKVTPPLSQTKE